MLRQVHSLPKLKSSASTANAVFLLTKGLSSWLNDEKFLHDAVMTLFGNEVHSMVKSISPSPVMVNVLFAVVDRLPAPSPVYANRGQDRAGWGTSLQGRQRIVLIDDHGSEGLAYGSSWNSDLFPTSLFGTQTAGFQQFSTSNNPATLSFIVPSASHQISEGRLSTNTTITLPLANTVFSNNRAATMFTTQWSYEAETNKLTYMNTSDVNHASINLPAEKMGKGKGIKNVFRSQDRILALSTPLVPLTPLLEVKDAMGNIIRTLAASDEPDSDIVPASQDLERAVATYFVKHQMDPQAVSIWALVVPKPVNTNQPTPVEAAVLGLIKRLNISILEHLSGTSSEGLVRRDFVPSSITTLLWSGASMHRVQSGGGGWGKKAGLLSLDPDIEYTREEAKALDFDFDNDDLELPSFSGLKTAASPGDRVAFFVQAPEGVGRPTVVHLQTRDDEQRATSLDFGVIPSTSDNMEDDVSANSPEAATQANLTTFDNHFGALSETGMAIESTSSQSSHVHKTKIDMPWSRLSQQNLAWIEPPAVPKKQTQLPHKIRQVDSFGPAIKVNFERGRRFGGFRSLDAFKAGSSTKSQPSLTFHRVMSTKRQTPEVEKSASEKKPDAQGGESKKVKASVGRAFKPHPNETDISKQRTVITKYGVGDTSANAPAVPQTRKVMYVEKSDAPDATQTMQTVADNISRHQRKAPPVYVKHQISEKARKKIDKKQEWERKKAKRESAELKGDGKVKITKHFAIDPRNPANTSLVGDPRERKREQKTKQLKGSRTDAVPPGVKTVDGFQLDRDPTIEKEPLNPDGAKPQAVKIVKVFHLDGGPVIQEEPLDPENRFRYFRKARIGPLEGQPTGLEIRKRITWSSIDDVAPVARKGQEQDRNLVRTHLSGNRASRRRNLVRTHFSVYRTSGEPATSPSDLELAVKDGPSSKATPTLADIRAAVQRLAASGKEMTISTYQAVRSARLLDAQQRQMNARAAQRSHRITKYDSTSSLSPKASESASPRQAGIRLIKADYAVSPPVYSPNPPPSPQRFSKGSYTTLTPHQIRRRIRQTIRTARASVPPRLRTPNSRDPIRRTLSALRIRRQLSLGPEEPEPELVRKVLGDGMPEDALSERAMREEQIGLARQRGEAVLDKLNRISKARELHVLGLLSEEGDEDEGGERMPWEIELEEEIEEPSTLYGELDAEFDLDGDDDVVRKAKGGRLRRGKKRAAQDWDVQAIFDELSKFDQTK